MLNISIIQFIHKQYMQGKDKYITNVWEIMIYHMQYSSTQVYILTLCSDMLTLHSRILQYVLANIQIEAASDFEYPISKLLIDNVRDDRTDICWCNSIVKICRYAGSEKKDASKYHSWR